MASTSTITFGPQDRESCTEVEIINDDVTDEAPELFQVDFLVSQPDELGMTVVTPVSNVTIIDDDVGECAYTKMKFIKHGPPN